MSLGKVLTAHGQPLISELARRRKQSPFIHRPGEVSSGSGTVPAVHLLQSIVAACLMPHCLHPSEHGTVRTTSIKLGGTIGKDMIRTVLQSSGSGATSHTRKIMAKLNMTTTYVPHRSPRWDILDSRITQETPLAQLSRTEQSFLGTRVQLLYCQQRIPTLAYLG